MKARDKFEKYIKQEVESLEYKGAEEMWKKFEGNNPQVTPPRKFWIFPLATLILLLAAMGFYFNTNRSASNAKDNELNNTTKSEISNSNPNRESQLLSDVNDAQHADDNSQSISLKEQEKVLPIEQSTNSIITQDKHGVAKGGNSNVAYRENTPLEKEKVSSAKIKKLKREVSLSTNTKTIEPKADVDKEFKSYDSSNSTKTNYIDINTTTDLNTPAKISESTRAENLLANNASKNDIQNSIEAESAAEKNLAVEALPKSDIGLLENDFWKAKLKGEVKQQIDKVKGRWSAYIGYNSSIGRSQVTTDIPIGQTLSTAQLQNSTAGINFSKPLAKSLELNLSLGGHYEAGNIVSQDSVIHRIAASIITTEKDKDLQDLLGVYFSGVVMKKFGKFGIGLGPKLNFYIYNRYQIQRIISSVNLPDFNAISSIGRTVEFRIQDWDSLNRIRIGGDFVFQYQPDRRLVAQLRVAKNFTKLIKQELLITDISNSSVTVGIQLNYLINY